MIQQNIHFFKNYLRDNYVALQGVITFPRFFPYFDLLQVSFLMYNVMSSELSPTVLSRAIAR